MSTATSPVVKGWELGLRLRERREQLGLTATAVAKRIPCTQTFISMTEAGRPKLTASRLAQLCRIYDIDTEEAAELEQLRLGANEKAWWQEYSGLFSAELQRYFGFEAGAETCLSYEGCLVPGMLQTESYARAVIADGSPYIRLTEVDQRVECRLRRQARVSSPPNLKLVVILGEGALHQEVGGRAVMHEQLDRVARLARESEHVEVRVLPFTAGAHPALGGPFHVLSFASPRLRSIAWCETLTSTAITDDPSQVREYSMAFHYAIERTLTVEDSLQLIGQRAKELQCPRSVDGSNPAAAQTTRRVSK